ncbi:hypothetical protein HDU77_008521 [Chytriomyces hyalinus]|nr:hypothetical protein HDU77_008521 [Chytriomyces hyalinus]
MTARHSQPKRLKRRCMVLAALAFVLAALFLTKNLSISKEKYDSVPLLSEKDAPRILYYNRHSACHNNMAYITSRLGLNLTRLKAGFLGDLGMREHRQNPADRCSSHIIVEVTNRFDWGIADFDEYHQLIWQLHHASPPTCTGDADDTLANPEFRIFRPSGFTNVPPNAVSPQEKTVALLSELDNCEVLAAMRELQIPFNQVIGPYGGPHTLKQYRAYIEFPYQVSTMKLHENLAAGVVMLIPSHSFFKELKRIHAFGPWEMLRRMVPNWHEYMDYYVPELNPYIYYFNSFDHLREILSSSKDLDTKNVRVTAPAAHNRITQDMFHGWADLFAEIGFPNLLTAYGAVKAWKVKQRDEQIQIWDNNQKKLTPFELEMKEAAQTGSQYYEKKRKQEAHRPDLFHTPFDPAEALESVLSLADKEVHMEFKAQDFETFGHLARYLHVAHHVVREHSLDSSVTLKIPRLIERASTLTETLTKQLYPWIMNDKVSSVNDMMGQWTGRGIAFTSPQADIHAVCI